MWFGSPRNQIPDDEPYRAARATFRSFHREVRQARKEKTIKNVVCLAA
jgi:hypothetical protein